MSISKETPEFKSRNYDIERRVKLRELLSELPGLFENPPENWAFLILMKLRHVQKHLVEFPLETQEYLRPILEKAFQLLEEEKQFTKNHLASPPFSYEVRGTRADELIMGISRFMAEPFGVELVPIEAKFIFFEELVCQHPEKIRLISEVVNGTKIRVAILQHPFDGTLHRVRLPFDGTIWKKGGETRALLDILAGAPSGMLAAELPFNDVDVVASGDQEAARTKATLLGADHSGVEMKRGKLDYTDYANSRDMTINMAAITNEGLLYCEQALEAARTGIAEISGNYRPDKAIYNTDRFTWWDSDTDEREILAKQRGISREVKATAEGKIIGFKYKNLNANTPLGIYCLWLAKRWTKYIVRDDLCSDRFGDLLQNMFILMEKMEQVPTGTRNVMDLLESTHRDYPYFDIGREMETIIDEVRWKARKLIKQADREYSWATNVPSNYRFTRSPSDTIERIISLGDFRSDPKLTREIIEWYPGFVQSCRARTGYYDSLNLRPVQRYFFELDTETGPMSGGI